MNNLHRILVVAILALATNHAIAVSVPMDKTLADAAAFSGQERPQTLGEAVDASNSLRGSDGSSSRREDKRNNNLRVGSQSEAAGDNPQTLQEAIAASNAKRDDDDGNEGRKPLSNNHRIGDQPDANAVGDNPQTLQEAIAASNAKREDDDGNERRNPLSNNHRIGDDPDSTLADAISASNAKRFDVGFGSNSPAVSIIDRESLGIHGPERPLGVEDADMEQSAIIGTSKKEPVSGGFFPGLRDYAVAFHGRHRRDYTISGMGCVSRSGSVASRKISVVGWIAATCLFVAQVW